jgi:hypothetical protein
VASHPLKAAPRRRVRDVQRRGDWGEVTYHHVLSCGHTEVRKRRTAHVVIACSGCLTAADFAAGVLPQPPPAPLGMPESLVDDFAGVETEAGRVRAGLAKRFGVDGDAVDVVLRGDGLAYALVFLERDVAVRLAGLDTTPDKG